MQTSAKMNEIQAKIKQFGDEKNVIALQEYIEHLDTNEVSM